MTNEVANLVREELRALRHGQGAIQHAQEALQANIAGVKIAAGQSATVPGLAFNLAGHLQSQIASRTMRMDRFENGIDRILGRLDCVDACGEIAERQKKD